MYKQIEACSFPYDLNFLRAVSIVTPNNTAIDPQVVMPFRLLS